MTACDTVRISLGALAMSALDATEEQRIREHLATCSRCVAEFAELSSTVRLLAAARLEALPAAEPGPRVLDDLLAIVGEERRRSRRRRLVLGVAAAAASAVVAGTGVLLMTGGEPAPASTPAAVATPTAELHGSNGPVAVDIAVFTKAWGTAVRAEISGVPPGATCSLVAVGNDGTREVAGTWTVPRDGYDPATGLLRFDGGVGLGPHEVSRYEIVTTDGEVLAVAPAT